MEKWSEGIFLLGKYNPLQVGCWLLTKGNEAAIVEMPPYSQTETPPWQYAQQIASENNLKVRYLLCTHAHGDHLNMKTLRAFYQTFPESIVVLQQGFQPYTKSLSHIEYIEENKTLYLNNEPLYLVHAPKHSWTDTMIVFRGAMIAGDWELNTIRSVHDNKGTHSVPDDKKLTSIDNLVNFFKNKEYLIHKIFAVHANDRRDNIDFETLMQDTKIDRVFW